MFEVFEKYIREQTTVGSEDLKLMRSLSTTRRLRRRELLLQEGETCRYKAFVARGLLRNYMLKDNGMEYVMRFSPENSWSVDGESFNKQIPSRFNIEALEESDLVLWNYENVRILFDASPTFRAFSEKLIATNLNASRDRILMNISASSEEKYERFISDFPDVFNRVPLHMVASYLGVSRETLSRVRHARVKQGREH
ncbi:MAG: Crp/Fnr family transcriptional regulator [Bacteroidetes bacterium]|nr:Crp/Fnr family transcriptional regulator [Bacteroidota bacterium]